MNGQRGDDLDDDFVPDELVATSGEEDNGPGDDIGGLLSADEDTEEAEAHIKEKTTTEKKRKRREKEKERKIKVCVTYRIIGLSLTSIIFRRRGSWQKQSRLSNLFQWQRNLLTISQTMSHLCKPKLSLQCLG
jgi:hypothetical protein